MAQKIDVFDGTINFKTDSPDRIEKVLKSLEEYLLKYEEKDAASIVNQFTSKVNGGDSTLGGNSQEERIRREKAEKMYAARTDVLIDIRNKLNKISDDLVDEQKTEAKAGKAGWAKKTGEIAGKAIDTAKTVAAEAKSFFDDPVGWIKDFVLNGVLGKLFGGLLGKGVGGIAKLVGGLVKGLFGAGKLGAKLVFGAVGALFSAGKAGANFIFDGVKKSFGEGGAGRKIVSNIIDGALRVGGAVFNRIKDFVLSLLPDFMKPKSVKATSKVAKAVSKAGDATKLAKAESALLKNTEKVVSQSTKATSSIAKGTSFFAKAWSKTKALGSAAWKGVKAVGSAVADGAKWVAGKAMAGVNALKGQFGKWVKIKDKISKVFGAVGKFFGGKSMAKKGGKAIAGAMAKGMGKAVVKFVPILGWSMLAWDLYSAYKRTKGGVVSFAINFIDEVAGGLIGLATGQFFKDIPEGGLGDYIENLIKGNDANGEVSFGPEDMISPDDIRIDGMDETALKVAKELDKVTMDENGNDLEILNKALEGNPNKDAIMQQYSDIITKVKNGEITKEQGRVEFKKLAVATLVDSAKVAKNQNGEIVDVSAEEAEMPVEVTKVENIDENAHNVEDAQMVQNAVIATKVAEAASARTAAEVSADIASTVAGVTAQVNVVNGGNGGAPQTPSIEG